MINMYLTNHKTEKLKNDRVYYGYIALIVITFIIFYPVVSGMPIASEYVDSLNINPEEYGKFYFYTGDVEFEHLFLKPTIDMYQYFRKHGFEHDKVSLLVDASKAHCEAAWSEHFIEAIRFWLK